MIATRDTATFLRFDVIFPYLRIESGVHNFMSKLKCVIRM